MREQKKEECISKGVHESSWCVSVGRGWVIWYTVLKMYRQQNCNSNLCRPVDCLDFKRFHRFVFLFFFLFFVCFFVVFFSFQLRFCPQWQKG